MTKQVCSNCKTTESKEWIKKEDKQFCSKMCQDAFDKKGGPGTTCEFC